MIEEARGNLLEADAEAFVNTVNTVGHMGKGIALRFKQAYPENFLAYARAVKRLIAVYQTEQECGDDRNDWRYCRYAWTLMKHYLRSTVVVIQNNLAEPLPVRIRIGDRTVAPTLPADAFSTLVVKGLPGSAA
jgi:hypothetical protein